MQNAIDPNPLALNRADAGVRLAYGAGEPVSRLQSLTEWGGYRAKFPTTDARAEAVLINTGGGVAGGDKLQIEVALEAGAALTITTQSAERIYRSLGDDARITTQLDVAAGADLVFVPQETILFSRARLARTIDADMALDARLLLAEMTVFGRAAMGERVTGGSWRDRWRIRRIGTLVYADDVRIEGNIHELLAHAAIGHGVSALATVLYVAPDAAERLKQVRAGLASATCRAAASSWNGLLSVRVLGNPQAVRSIMASTITTLSRRPLPRVWCM